MDLGSREESPELAELVGERSELVLIGEESQVQCGQEAVDSDIPSVPQNTPEKGSSSETDSSEPSMKDLMTMMPQLILNSEQAQKKRDRQFEEMKENSKEIQKQAQEELRQEMRENSDRQFEQIRENSDRQAQEIRENTHQLVQEIKGEVYQAQEMQKQIQKERRSSYRK